jgi:hypothetical protein
MLYWHFRRLAGALTSGKNILCMADDTVESTHVSKTGKLLVDGYMEHQCRDARPLYRAAGGVMKDEDVL